jgi:hypothetical protein
MYVEKQKEEREELIKAVKKLWEEDKRSVTEGFNIFIVCGKCYHTKTSERKQ